MSVPTNPFPGMNPFLQQFWSDVHGRLVTYIGDALAGELPDDLSARTEESVAVTGDEKPPAYRADIAVVETWKRGFPPVWKPDGGDAATPALAEPLVFRDEPEPERWVEIRDVRGHLITVIEVLSPVNKRPDGWIPYRRKQHDFIASGVNLVEIDLIHGGSHVTAISLEWLTFPPGTCHHICVTRTLLEGSNRREVYLCPLREPLPNFRVPLRLSDPDMPLALQPLIDRCYQTGRYWQIDHARSPEPPVAADDLPWIDERLRAAGLR